MLKSSWKFIEIYNKKIYFTSWVVCSCCSTSSVVLVVTRGPESLMTSPSSRTTWRFTLVWIWRVVVISFFLRVSHSSVKGNLYVLIEKTFIILNNCYRIIYVVTFFDCCNWIFMVDLKIKFMEMKKKKKLWTINNDRNV